MWCVKLKQTEEVSTIGAQRKVERQVKVLILNIWLFSFCFPARSFCQYHSKFSCWKLLTKNRRNKDKSSQMSLFSDVFTHTLPVYSEFFATFFYCLHFDKFVCILKRLQRLKQEWQKSPAGTNQNTTKLGLVWRNIKKISQIIKDYFYLPFFLLIILCIGA